MTVLDPRFARSSSVWRLVGASSSPKQIVRPVLSRRLQSLLGDYRRSPAARSAPARRPRPGSRPDPGRKRLCRRGYPAGGRAALTPSRARVCTDVVPAIAAGQLRIGLTSPDPWRELIDRALEPAQQPRTRRQCPARGSGAAPTNCARRQERPSVPRGPAPPQSGSPSPHCRQRGRPPGAALPGCGRREPPPASRRLEALQRMPEHAAAAGPRWPDHL